MTDMCIAFSQTAPFSKSAFSKFVGGKTSSARTFDFPICGPILPHYQCTPQHRVKDRSLGQLEKGKQGGNRELELGYEKNSEKQKKNW